MTHCHPLTPDEELDLAHCTIAKCRRQILANKLDTYPDDGELRYRISIAMRLIQVIELELL